MVRGKRKPVIDYPGFCLCPDSHQFFLSFFLPYFLFYYFFKIALSPNPPSSAWHCNLDFTQSTPNLTVPLSHSPSLSLSLYMCVCVCACVRVCVCVCVCVMSHTHLHDFSMSQSQNAAGMFLAKSFPNFPHQTSIPYMTPTPPSPLPLSPSSPSRPPVFTRKNRKRHARVSLSRRPTWRRRT